MTADWRDMVADCLHDISQCLATKYRHQSGGILLLCDFEVGIGYDVFLGKGDVIEYQDSDSRDDLAHDLLFEIKYAVPMTHQFEQLELFIKDGRFSTKLVYLEDIGPDRKSAASRDAVVFSYFGERPIIYPETQEDHWTL